MNTCLLDGTRANVKLSFMTYATCKNHAPGRAWDKALKAQVGWTEDGRRRMVEHVPAWLEGRECVHGGNPAADPACEGCMWRKESKDGGRESGCQ